MAPEDVARFAELDLAADLQLSGFWTQPEFLHDNDFLVGAQRVDERAYRLRDLHDAGARVVLSTDFDIGPMSPFIGVARAIDRGEQRLPWWWSTAVCGMRRAATSPAPRCCGPRVLNREVS